MRKKEEQLRAEKLVLRDQASMKRQRLIPVPNKFNPEAYQVDFLFLQGNGERYLTLLDRDEIVTQINWIAVKSSPPKFSPIVISTSSGMGKTFLLKMIGLQRVPAELTCQRIEDARRYGRIISFDFLAGGESIAKLSQKFSF